MAEGVRQQWRLLCVFLRMDMDGRKAERARAYRAALVKRLGALTDGPATFRSRNVYGMVRSGRLPMSEMVAAV